MNSSLSQSYAWCEQVARREAGNFYHGFRILPRPQRQSMCALYAFLRIADDLSDGNGHVEEKRIRLGGWRKGLEQALAGDYGHRLHAALHHTLKAHRIPPHYLHEVLDGVEMDLEPVAYETFADLRLYCYRVASAVGLACIHIWGFSDEQAKDYAITAGLAFQLTNILRDLGEDAARGRIYLPQEDLKHFDYPSEALRRGERDERFRALMDFQVQRARHYYESAWPLLSLLPPPGRAVFLVLARTYRSLLDAIQARGYDVFSKKVQLSPWRKCLLALQALPVRWNWM